MNGRIPAGGQVYTDWIIGWKAAATYIRESNELIFMPLIYRHMHYEVESMAVCHYADHKHPPHDGCRCGFNAWHDADQAVSYMQPYARYYSGKAGVTYKGPHKIPVAASNNTLVILRVGLHGDVIEGSRPAWGYRAERQLVTDVFFNDICSLCPRDATCLGAVNSEYPLLWHLRHTTATSLLVWPLCGRHADLAVRSVKPSEIALRNNVEVHWGYPASL